jgi:RND family efflux transporter MFP subunit
MRTRKLERRALPLVLLLAACGQGGGATNGNGSAEHDEPFSVEVAVAAAREIPVTLTLDGTLLADEDSNITSVVPGRVLEVLVERGSRVEAGAPLLRLRDVDYRLQARAANAQLDQARARLGIEEGQAPPAPADTPEVRAARATADLARTTLERSEELMRRGALSQQELDEVRNRAATADSQYQSALNNARAAVASLASAQVALNQASTSVNEAVVRAPFAGEIADRMVSVGEFVAPQTPLVTLVRTDPLRIEVQVPQQSLRAVRVGQRVEVRVDALPDETFQATIRYVSAAVRRDTRGLMVEAVIENDDGLLRPGMFARARIDTGETKQTAVVPARAVLSLAGVERVFVVRDGSIEERVVTIADRTSEEVVIDTGVEAGEQVATDHVGELADGMHVTVNAG